MVHSDAIRRLRAAGDNEWSVMQVLGHMVEMIPYWLGHCRVLIAATAEPPVFGHGPGAPERLAGIERSSTGDPKELLGLLNDDVEAAARAIREMSAAERSKKGIHIKLGELTVADSLERFIVAHAEEHLEQIRAALLGWDSLSNVEWKDDADARRLIRGRVIDDRWRRIDRRRVVATVGLIHTPAFLVPAALIPFAPIVIIAERRRDEHTADH
jgi:hypothetical protein